MIYSPGLFTVLGIATILNKTVLLSSLLCALNIAHGFVPPRWSEFPWLEPLSLTVARAAVDRMPAPRRQVPSSWVATSGPG